MREPEQTGWLRDIFGKRVRVVAHLINASADRKLWAETYNKRDLGDILRLPRMNWHEPSPMGSKSG